MEQCANELKVGKEAYVNSYTNQSRPGEFFHLKKGRKRTRKELKVERGQVAKIQ